MKATPTALEGVFIIEPRVIEDSRGYFFESYNSREFEKAVGFAPNFVQDNQSCSQRGVMRGMHYQLPPYEQTKLVRVLNGVILDVVIDVRVGSPTYGKHICVELSSENKKQMFMPPGFAHGIVALSEKAEIMYKCDQFYAPGYEGGVYFADPVLNIDWHFPLDQLIISEKDLQLPMFADAPMPFIYGA